MDDTLEQPSFPPAANTQEDDAQDFSGDDDEGPDWTKLKSFASSSKPSLPKRGDKEFEPSSNGPTNLQIHSLNRARDAMFGALDAQREISNKSVSYAVWYRDLARAEATQMRGVLFNGMGHSVPRPISRFSKFEGDKKHKIHKRTELLPEETLYLIERGSLFCWKDEPRIQLPNEDQREISEGGPDAGEHAMHGSPMSVQQAYAEMIGREDLTLERYHAYAYLKRLGYNVLRANPPSAAYPSAAAAITSSPRTHSYMGIFTPLLNMFVRLRRYLFGQINWEKPLDFGWFGCAHNYVSVYRALRIIPAGHTVPLHSSTAPAIPTTLKPPNPSPYEIFYNVYKPNTPFRKSAPPAPDFQLVVVNARTTPLPSIYELTNLWSCLPESPPPLPRKRLQANTKTPLKPEPPLKPHPPPSESQTLFTRLYSWVRRGEGKPQQPAERKTHPFAVLKNGKKTIVIGIVDSGTVGFFRFSMGAFEEMPMA